MTVKEWLERGFKLNLEIKQLQQAKENAKAMADMCTDDAEVMNSYREFCRELFRRIESLLEISKQVVQAVQLVDDLGLRCLLTARYINFKNWEEIADELEMSERWIYRLHKRALEEVEKKLKIKN